VFNLNAKMLLFLYSKLKSYLMQLIYTIEMNEKKRGSERKDHLNIIFDDYKK